MAATAPTEQQAQRFLFSIVKSIAESRNELASPITEFIDGCFQALYFLGLHLCLKVDRMATTAARFKKLSLTNNY